MDRCFEITVFCYIIQLVVCWISGEARRNKIKMKQEWWSVGNRTVSPSSIFSWFYSGRQLDMQDYPKCM